MILVVGGTKEAKRIVRILRSKNNGQDESGAFKSTYGEDMSNGVVFLPRSLNCPMTAHLIRKYAAEILIDAAPVYLKGASIKTMSACRMTGIRYIRFEPPAVSLDKNNLSCKAMNVEEACNKAMELGKTIFLNIGNDKINIFTKRAAQENKKIVVRISAPGALTNSLKLGIDRHDILLIDGIFSKDFNRGLIKEYGISVFVTRDLGAGNGTEQELSAAEAEKIPVIVIEKPVLQCSQVINDYDNLALLMVSQVCVKQNGFKKSKPE